VGVDRRAVEVPLGAEVAGQDERDETRVPLPAEVVDLLGRPRVGRHVSRGEQDETVLPRPDLAPVDEEDARARVLPQLPEEAGTGTGGAVGVDGRPGERKLGEGHPGTVSAPRSGGAPRVPRVRRARGSYGWGRDT